MTHSRDDTFTGVPISGAPVLIMEDRQNILTVRQALFLSTTFLAKKGSQSARLDSQILTAHVLGIKRLDLYLTPERPFSSDEKNRLR